ncbi:hypothetical protein [Halobacterium zhouii]|uniref:hypothetical protein n=1 Tax=Halobacterium zhouii TaxID=2902624 RepID=UPI001E5F3B2C|nr:hypothetical protein [Halobacterium zhouii]
MDADAVRNQSPSRSHPDRVRNALLGAVVFELAVVAGFTADVSGGLADVFVFGLLLSLVTGTVGFVAFCFYLATA